VDREEATSLQKLALQSLPGDSALWRTEWRDVLAQLDQQTLQQRVEEIKALQSETGLSDEEKDELRQLMKLIGRR
ncbi:MAG TPA: DNA primase, partial [Xanthomonadaceae bacterium]|nr:DNA primase [Xanthomonadaceae bacterium]